MLSNPIFKKEELLPQLLTMCQKPLTPLLPLLKKTASPKVRFLLRPASIWCLLDGGMMAWPLLPSWGRSEGPSSSQPPHLPGFALLGLHHRRPSACLQSCFPRSLPQACLLIDALPTSVSAQNLLPRKVTSASPAIQKQGAKKDQYPHA